MHTAALQYLNINGSYRTFETSEKELKKIFNQLKDSGIRGLNVTIPHKTSVITLLDELTDTAKLIGAVNTIIFKNGKSLGENTDVTGFWQAIPEKIREKVSSQNISIVGCGGAAQAIVIALLLNKVKQITIYGRNKEKLSGFKEFVNSRNEQLKTKSKIETDLLNNINLSNTSMLVNTTPIGMYPDINNSPIKKEELQKLPKNALVYDIIYNPLETQLLKDAKDLNKLTLNGIEMLIRQGAASLAIWLEQEVAPLGVMRLALYSSLVSNEELHTEE